MIDKEKSNLKNKKTKKILLVAIIALVVSSILISGSMAYYKRVVGGNKKYVITASSVILVLDETSNDITIDNTLPQTDEDGMNNSAYTFSIENMVSDMTYQYTIYLEDNEIEDGATRVSDEFIKYYLTNDSLTTQKDPALLSSLSTDENGRILETGTIAGGTKYNYTLRFWVDYDATQTDAAGKAFSVKLNIIAKQKYENLCISAVNGEDTSNAETPRLTSGMIPVVYDECEKKWLKADTSEAWYNYDNQEWANAVTVTEDTRDAYMAMDSGEPISMDDINTMWVWIPRYEYQYTDLGTSYPGWAQPGELNVNFISSDTTTPSDSTKYQIPEGFKFGEENIPGFWMGKFETSTLESCPAANNSVNTACDLTTLTPQIKPNVTSWRGARVSTFSEASRLMQSSDDTLTYNADTYGFDVEGASSMDSHMLKNTEWGIVAMLSQSKYGKYGNTNYTGANKEVYQNKSDLYITGMSNGTPSTSTYADSQVTYDTPDMGCGASTTGTIYGVYDMSGGGYEYVMGNYNNISGNSSTDNSGFCGTNGPTDGTCREWPNAKYFDLYTSDIVTSAYKFGDGTYETFNWYSDYAYFVDSYYPWFPRGGDYNDDATAGVFHFSSTSGKSSDNFASRFAIKP